MEVITFSVYRNFFIAIFSYGWTLQFLAKFSVNLRCQFDRKEDRIIKDQLSLL